MSEFRVFKVKSKWRWSLVATNGKTVAQSDSYDSQDDARRSVSAVKQAVEEAEREVAYPE